MFGSFSRLIAVAMAAVVCFALLVPMALRERNSGLASVVTIIFLIYGAANVMLWARYRKR